MDQDLKKKWLKALRSGKYTQATGVLFDGKSFCCLGVLCDIGLDGEWERTNPHAPDEDAEYRLLPDDILTEAKTSTLPRAFAQAAKISYGDEDELIKLNDDHGADFNEIADWIEDNL